MHVRSNLCMNKYWPEPSCSILQFNSTHSWNFGDKCFESKCWILSGFIGCWSLDLDWVSNYRCQSQCNATALCQRIHIFEINQKSLQNKTYKIFKCLGKHTATKTDEFSEKFQGGSFQGMFFNQFPCWTVVLHASHGKYDHIVYNSPAIMNIRTFVAKSRNMIFRKWGGVKGRLELFWKFICFGVARLP